MAVVIIECHLIMYLEDHGSSIEGLRKGRRRAGDLHGQPGRVWRVLA